MHRPDMEDDHPRLRGARREAPQAREDGGERGGLRHDDEGRAPEGQGPRRLRRRHAEGRPKEADQRHVALHAHARRRQRHSGVRGGISGHILLEGCAVHDTRTHPGEPALPHRRPHRHPCPERSDGPVGRVPPDRRRREARTLPHPLQGTLVHTRQEERCRRMELEAPRGCRGGDYGTHSRHHTRHKGTGPHSDAIPRDGGQEGFASAACP